MYCGNNRNSRQVRNGARIGSRYECMKKGIGVGINLPLDPDYKRTYIPLDSRKIYCGESPRLPEGYDILGTSYMCFTKGIGVGKGIKAKKAKDAKKGKDRNNKKKNKK